MYKRRSFLIIILAIGLCGFAQSTCSTANSLSLAKRFSNLPHEARPWGYFCNTIEVKDENSKKHTSNGGHISPPSHFFDGVKPEANWIWNSGEINPRNYYLYVRKSFSLDNPPKEAKAFVSAFAFAELYINGQYIDRVPTNPDPEYQTYEKIDLSSYLKRGKNSVAALVYNSVSVERGLVGKVPGWVVLDHPDTYPMDVDGENTGMNSHSLIGC